MTVIFSECSLTPSLRRPYIHAISFSMIRLSGQACKRRIPLTFWELNCWKPCHCGHSWLSDTTLDDRIHAGVSRSTELIISTSVPGRNKRHCRQRNQSSLFCGFLPGIPLSTNLFVVEGIPGTNPCKDGFHNPLSLMPLTELPSVRGHRSVFPRAPIIGRRAIRTSCNGTSCADSQDVAQ